MIIVSASMESWLDGWCKKNNLEIIAARLEIKEQILTGKFATRNCHGLEKANRVIKAYDLSLCEYIYAYGVF